MSLSVFELLFLIPSFDFLILSSRWLAGNPFPYPAFLFHRDRRQRDEKRAYNNNCSRASRSQDASASQGSEAEPKQDKWLATETTSAGSGHVRLS